MNQILTMQQIIVLIVSASVGFLCLLLMPFRAFEMFRCCLGIPISFLRLDSNGGARLVLFRVDIICT